MPRPLLASRLAALAVPATLVGCVGTLGTDLPAPAPSSVRDVALTDAARLTAERACITMASGESLLDVTADGDVWIGTAAGARVVSRHGITLDELALRAGRADWALALGPSRALVGASGSVFRIDGELVEPVDLPSALGRPIGACGDSIPSAQLALRTDTGVYLRRGGVWARLDVASAPLLPWAALAEEGGACTGREGAFFLAHEEGVVAWDAEETDATILTRLRVPEALSRQGALVASVAGGLLRVRTAADEPVDTIRLDLGAVTAASVGAGRVWAIAGGELVRRETDGRLERLGMRADALEVVADETGGAWVLSAGGRELCRAATEDGLAIRGLSPHERVAGARAFRVEAGLPADHLEVRVDGRVVHRDGATDVGDGWDVPATDLGEPGWHDVVVTADVLGIELRRELEVHVPEVRTFADDVAPIFAAQCAGCHGERGAQSRLDRYETWRAMGPRMLVRIAAGEMPPPPAARVSAHEVDVIQQWLEGGMLP